MMKAQLIMKVCHIFHSVSSAVIIVIWHLLANKYENFMSVKTKAAVKTYKRILNSSDESENDTKSKKYKTTSRKLFYFY